MKKHSILLFLLTLSIGMTAQKTQEQAASTSSNQHAIGIGAGSGFALDYSYKINNRLSISSRFNMLAYSVEELEQEVDGQNVLIDATVDFKNIDIVFSYYPFNTAFRLIGGVGYFTDNSLNMNLSFDEKVTIGEVEFTPDQVGEITIDNKWQQVAPYAGIAFGRAVPNSKFGFAVELGTYFSGAPEVSLDATGIIENTKNQETLLQDSFSELKYRPYLSLRLSYSI
jgi:hypothetical protein